MRISTLVAVSLVLLVGPALVIAQDATAPKKKSKVGVKPKTDQRQTFRSPAGKELQYSLFVPPGDAPPAGWPLVLCLHGRGGGTDAGKTLITPASQRKHPTIVLAPHAGDMGSWVERPDGQTPPGSAKVAEVLALLDQIMQQQKVDPNRVYLTGQSMGGRGTWGMLAGHADRFAAAAPVCGPWETTADAEKMKHVPLWVFHGDADPLVPVQSSRDMVAALKAAGADVRYTEYPGVGHNSWVQAYATAELWDWMFTQRRPASE